jgi:phosphoribosylformylglycinamidine synthase
VQKGDAPEERKILRLFLDPEVTKIIKRCNDFGAGGVSVAIGELAEGIDVNLDKVTVKYDGLDGTELAISESQERMAVVIAERDLEEFCVYAAEENVEVTSVARVTDTGRFRIFWQGEAIFDVSREFLDTNGTTQEAEVTVKAIEPIYGGDMENDFIETLGGLDCCSQKGLIERFDSTIGAATLLAPLGGIYQLTPALGMAAKLPLLREKTNTATLMAYGYNPKISKASPFHGAMYAVLESITKIAAMGGDISKIRLTFQEYFEKLNSPESWGKPFPRFSAHSRYRGRLIFRRLAEKTACPEHSWILMFLQP